MKRVLRNCSVLMLLCAASAHAQLYKWVGPDGKVTYSDTPPPKTAARVETKAALSSSLDTSNLPYELALAVKNHPVTLYTTKDCGACDEGRSLLSSRGIPFTEKTVNTPKDVAQFREAGGDGKLPLLAIGRIKERGFEASAWNNALTVAGYPASSVLPKSYRNPPAVAAAPQKPVPAKQEDTKTKAVVEPPATDLPPATGNAPPGFRF